MEATIAENLGIYPSEYITGHVDRKEPRTAGEVCFREATIAAFWRAAVKAISAQMDSDRDGRIYTSEELEVILRSAVGTVQTGHVHTGLNQLGDAFGRLGGRTDGVYDLGFTHECLPILM